MHCTDFCPIECSFRMTHGCDLSPLAIKKKHPNFLFQLEMRQHGIENLFVSLNPSYGVLCLDISALPEEDGAC